MKTCDDLRRQLRAIDHRGYPAYKDLKGQYDFGEYTLSIDHVQGDPFAAPSRLSVSIPTVRTGFPAQYYDSCHKRITLQDHLTRLFGAEISKGSMQARGSGKSGLLSVSRCGQEILERTACRISERSLKVRFEAGFPAHGRTIDAQGLDRMLFSILPGCVKRSLFLRNIDRKALQDAINLCEDQQFIRERLDKDGLCAFIADGSVLPRESGVSDRPMKDAVPFISPESMSVEYVLPHRGRVRGMGIPKGVTLFVGGGYHGKSTVLQALQNGVYNHVGGDGRELVITDSTAWKLRSEDGRSVTRVDISPFIRSLPGGRDTCHFSTEDASGSTSQAANLIESIESGSTLILIDEDTSATNFMIRDRLMQEVVCADEEPIIPFIERVRSLYEDLGISSIIVAGSSGSYFHAADRIIQMKEYVPLDITAKAKQTAASFPDFAASEGHFDVSALKSGQERRPRPYAALKKDDRLKLKSLGTSELSIAHDTVELRYIEQLNDPEQTAALAQILKYTELSLMDGRRSMTALADAIESMLDAKGLEGLFDHGDVRSSLARPRRQEIMACINRYRRLIM